MPIFRQFLPIYTKICTKKRQFLPIFRVKSVKIYTGEKKIYTGAARGARDKYEVWDCCVLVKEDFF